MGLQAKSKSAKLPLKIHAVQRFFIKNMILKHDNFF